MIHDVRRANWLSRPRVLLAVTLAPRARSLEKVVSRTRRQLRSVWASFSQIRPRRSGGTLRIRLQPRPTDS